MSTDLEIDPTEEEIRAACLGFQASWTAEERELRARGKFSESEARRISWLSHRQSGRGKPRAGRERPGK